MATRSSMALPASSSVYGASSAASRSSTTLITPQVLALSDAAVPQVDAHLFDFLNIEMVRILLDSAEHAHARMQERRKLILRSLEETYGYTEPHETAESTAKPIVTDLQRQDDALRTRLEGIGFRTGWCLAERLARDKAPIQKQKPQPTPSNPTGIEVQPPLEPLEALKFVCKEIWVTLFDKQVDNLRTNHKGVFVIQDNALKPLLRISVADAQDVKAQEAALRKAKHMIGLYNGIIQGALAILGLNTVVTAEHSGGSQCIFHIKTTMKAPPPPLQA